MKKFVLGLIGLFILIQLLPIGRDHTNPPIEAEPQWDSPKTKALFDRACVDCHSHTTKWPWYSNIAPLSWIISDHVIEGREHFNVSLWGIQKENEGEEAAEELEKGEMPIFGYTITHPEARFSKEEKQRLTEGLEATFGREKD